MGVCFSSLGKVLQGGQPSLRPRSQPRSWLPCPWRDLLSSGVPEPGARLGRRLAQRYTTSTTTINHIKPGTSRPHLKWVNGKACPTGEVERIPSLPSLVSGGGDTPLERTREHSHLARGPGLMFHTGPRLVSPAPAPRLQPPEPVSYVQNRHCPMLARLTEFLKRSAHKASCLPGHRQLKRTSVSPEDELWSLVIVP